MNNSLVSGSNTLQLLLALSAGHCIDLKIMPISDEEVSFVAKLTPLKDGKAVKPLPDLKGTMKLANLDAELISDVTEIFKGELADQTARLSTLNKAMAKDEKAVAIAASGKTIVKPGDAMPPPTGRKEGAKTKTGPATPAGPPPPPAEAPSGDLFQAPTAVVPNAIPEPATASDNEGGTGAADDEEEDFGY